MWAGQLDAGKLLTSMPRASLKGMTPERPSANVTSTPLESALTEIISWSAFFTTASSAVNQDLLCISPQVRRLFHADYTPATLERQRHLQRPVLLGVCQVEGVLDLGDGQLVGDEGGHVDLATGDSPPPTGTRQVRVRPWHRRRCACPASCGRRCPSRRAPSPSSAVGRRGRRTPRAGLSGGLRRLDVPVTHGRPSATLLSVVGGRPRGRTESRIAATAPRSRCGLG